MTGHRPNKLDREQQERARISAGAILQCLSQASQLVRDTYSDVLTEEGPDLRLSTSLAEGADMIVAGAAREAGFRLDVILPFPREAYAEAQGFSAEVKTTFESFLSEHTLHSALELDGDPDDSNAAGLIYLAAGRRVVAHSDILIAVWDGEREDGIGGTAQVLREAIERAVPVVWIHPNGHACLVTDPSNLSNFGDNAAMLVQGGACSQELADLVRDLLAPPAASEEAGMRLRRFLKEPNRTGSTWSYYDLMRRILTGRRYTRRLDFSVDAATDQAWSRYQERARKIGGDGFANSTKRKLEARWRHADNVALHCSHAYRSTYVLNSILAGFAVLVGLLSVFWWTAENSVMAKAVCVIAEVLLILAILILTRQGKRSHKDWHVRWLDARSIAELLRSARMLSLVGSTAAARSQTKSHDDDAWIEWYVRATIREIGPPTGHLNADAIRIAIASAIEDEILGQIDYNESAKDTYHEIDHKLHVWGEILFKATLFVGIAYISAATTYQMSKLFHWAEFYNAMTGYKEPIKAIVTVLGAGLPAFGAAFFGIRAIGDFRIVSEQAERTLDELRDLRTRLETEAAKDNPTREHASRLLYDLAQTLVSDLRDWSKVYRARELQLPV